MSSFETDALSEIAASEPGTVLLQRAWSSRCSGRSLLFRGPKKVVEARTAAEIEPALDALDEAVSQGWHVAGYLSYEAGLQLEPALADLIPPTTGNEPLLWFGCYGTPTTVQEKEPPQAPPAAPACKLSFSLTEVEYARQVAWVLARIAAGDTYQANLTMEVTWQTSEPAALLYQRLLYAQPVAYAALLHPLPGWHVLSCSPELFFARDGERIEMRPMKGTAAPGLDMDGARSQAAWLAADEKNRAENVMIVDLLRNDLGRVCQMGSVETSNLFAVERQPTVLQMTSTVSGRLRPGIRYAELFPALFPSGSIVGAPKIHTIRLLQAMEQRRRGVYTGAIGYIAPGEKAEFNVAIRTVSLRAGQASMGVGSGIVADSEPALEYEECWTKTLFLTRGPSIEFELLETLLLSDGDYFLLEEHCERLRQSAEYFDFVFDQAKLRAVLVETALGWRSGERARVRLLLRRDGRISCTATALARVADERITLQLRPERTEPSDLYLRHKTTHRVLYDAAQREASDKGYADALFANLRGEITEGAIHNVIVVLDGKWWTPPLTCGLLPGVSRARLLSEGRVRERVVLLGDLANAEAIYVCNSVRGLRRVDAVVADAGRSSAQRIWSDRSVVADRLPMN